MSTGCTLGIKILENEQGISGVLGMFTNLQRVQQKYLPSSMHVFCM